MGVWEGTRRGWGIDVGLARASWASRGDAEGRGDDEGVGGVVRGRGGAGQRGDGGGPGQRRWTSTAGTRRAGG